MKSHQEADAGTSKTRTKPKTQNSNELKAPPPTLLLPLNTAFYLCLVSHILAALYAPIQDCDETFNYWEPLHYLVHGYGLETWEYSPEYSIRSWAYIVLHGIPTKLVSFLGKGKTFEFYFVRGLLGAVCAATETRLYSGISREINPRVGFIYLVIVAFSPGVFYASVAFLPSSFAMYTSSLALTAFLDRRNGSKSAQGIFWFATGALLGWPFAAALVIPFVLEDWLTALMSSRLGEAFDQYFKGAVRCMFVLLLQVAIDFVFYNKLILVPWKIVSYNVFSSGIDQGPDIFGTEPWHFYIRNLLLNFSLWTVLALGVAPLLLVQAMFSRHRTTKRTLAETAILTAPFYLWFAIFSLQPHKEERFMFPAYPFLALNASIALHSLLSWIGGTDPKTLLGKIPANVKLIVVIMPVLLAVNIGLLRILGTVTAYRAPLEVYDALSTETFTTAGTNVCVGKEWYRFPSSFFLPNESRAKFIKSEFDGLLPGEFLESTGKLGFLKGAQSIPPGMNNRNEEDQGKYISISECSYLVDSHTPTSIPSVNEPDYIHSKEWKVVSCSRFLDAGSTHLFARMIWVPDLPFFPGRLRRSWGKHCLLRRSQDAE